MSAGSKIIQMRTLIRAMTPYLDHRADCFSRSKMQRCTCDYETVLRQAQWLANADPGRTGFHRPRGEPVTNVAGKL